jgi:hypothetical protein
MKNNDGKLPFNKDDEGWKHDKFDLNNKSPRSTEVSYSKNRKEVHPNTMLRKSSQLKPRSNSLF